MCSCLLAAVCLLLGADIWNRLLIMPATNAASMSLFSAAQCIKTLNDVLAVSELFDALDVNKGPPTSSIDVANDFIASNDHMKHMFGTSSSHLINCELLCNTMPLFVCFLSNHAIANSCYRYTCMYRQLLSKLAVCSILVFAELEIFHESHFNEML